MSAARRGFAAAAGVVAAGVAVAAPGVLSPARAGQPDLPAPRGILSARLLPVAAGVVDLTRSGTTDWVFCGSPAAAVRKATGAGRIQWRTSPGAVASVARGPVNVRWSDGMRPPAAARESSAVVTDRGFTVTVPADPGLPQTLRLYVAALHGEGALVAHLSDNSAPDYTEIALTDVAGEASGVFAITYRSQLRGQHLTVEWSATGAYGIAGSVVLEAVTLGRVASADRPTCVRLGRPPGRVKDGG